MIKDSEWHEEKRQRCLEKYTSKTKMKSVRDWKKRMAITGITAKSIAEKVGTDAPRISEYITFLTEPSDEKFAAIEAILRDAELQTK